MTQPTASPTAPAAPAPVPPASGRGLTLPGSTATFQRPVSRITRQVPGCAAAGAAGIALLAWMGWIFSLPLLSRWLPGMPAMAPNTANALLLAALSLWLQRDASQSPLPSGPRRWIARLAGSLVFLFGAIKLAEYALGRSFGFQDLFFRVPTSEISAASPARMAPHTALSFCLLGPALVLVGASTKRFWRVGPWVAMVPGLIAIASLFGHWYGAIFSLPGYALLDRMALSTATALMLLSVGVLCLRPDERPVALLRDRGAAGKSLRRLLPVALLVPLLLSWVADLGERSGLWSPALGEALVAISSSLVLAVFIWQSARTTFSAERRVLHAQAALEETVQARTAELVTANAQLALSEARQRLAIDGAQLGTFYCPVPLGEILWNSKCNEHFWLPPGARVDFDLFYSILHPADREPTRQAVARALRDRTAYDVEYRTVAPDGSGRLRWVRAIGRGFYDEKTSQLLRFDGITIDITDRKLAEAALHESEARFRAMADATPVLILLTGPDKAFTYFNRPWLDFTGRTMAQEIGRGWLEGIHADDLDRWVETYATAFDAREPFELEFRLRRADGEYRWLLQRGLPRMAPDRAEFLGYAGSCIDITERRQAEQDRAELLHREQALRQDAETANRMKDEFLATLSHELRTPLNAILGWAHLLRGGDGPEDQETWSSGLEVIERNARAQVQLIEDLLDVSRVITGKLRLDARPVDLEDIVRAALDTVRPAAEARGVSLEPELHSRTGPINGDPDRLQQITWNLLTNAIKFTPRGGRVGIRLERVDTQVELRVSDTGAGIEPEFLPFLFDRFRQADSSITRQHGGLGLGLSIVRHLTEMHGGTVSADSPGLNQGTTLTVRLPRLIPHSETDPAGMEPDAAPADRDGAAEPPAAGYDGQREASGAGAGGSDGAVTASPRLAGDRRADGSGAAVANRHHPANRPLHPSPARWPLRARRGRRTRRTRSAGGRAHPRRRPRLSRPQRGRGARLFSARGWRRWRHRRRDPAAGRAHLGHRDAGGRWLQPHHEAARARSRLRRPVARRRPHRPRPRRGPAARPFRRV